MGTLCGGSSLLFAHIMALYGIQGKVITFDVADASQVPGIDCYKNQYTHGFGHPLWEKYVMEGRIIRVIRSIGNFSEVVVKEIAKLPNINPEHESAFSAFFSRRIIVVVNWTVLRQLVLLYITM